MRWYVQSMHHSVVKAISSRDWFTSFLFDFLTFLKTWCDKALVLTCFQAICLDPHWYLVSILVISKVMYKGQLLTICNCCIQACSSPPTFLSHAFTSAIFALNICMPCHQFHAGIQNFIQPSHAFPCSMLCKFVQEGALCSILVFCSNIVDHVTTRITAVEWIQMEMQE